MMNNVQNYSVETSMQTFESHLAPRVQCERREDFTAGFEGYRAFDMKAGEKLTKGDRAKNHIIVLLSGRARCVQEGVEMELAGEEMVLVASSEEFTMRCEADCRVLMHTFGALPERASEYLSQLYRRCSLYTGGGAARLRMTDVVADFARTVCKLIDAGLMSSWLSQQKAVEGVFLVLHTYDDVRVLSFFRNLINREQYFRNIVLRHCDSVKSIDELVARSGMCRTNFYKQFNREFGMSVHRWMQLRRAKAVKEAAARPMMSVRRLMEEHGFSSPSNFIRFCRLYFGCTPNELIRSCRNRAYTEV